ncbi:MAG TPA: hypothetical protein VHV32_18700, partial [Candidatus Angelobacter sp.]|nr:hypothetical protein [Candidatus Angelobacter sp.]
MAVCGSAATLTRKLGLLCAIQSSLRQYWIAAHRDDRFNASIGAHRNPQDYIPDKVRYARK